MQTKQYEFTQAKNLIEENILLIDQLKKIEVGVYRPDLNKFLAEIDNKLKNNQYQPSALVDIRTDFSEQLSFIK